MTKLAVLDLGSTAVRFLLARLRPGSGYRVLAQERVPTRLGGGAPGTLPRDAIDATLRAARRFLAPYSSRRREPRVIAVATSAVRDAHNRELLLDPLRRDEGIDVRILSVREVMVFGGYLTLVVCTRGVRDRILLDEALDGHP